MCKTEQKTRQEHRNVCKQLQIVNICNGFAAALAQTTASFLLSMCTAHIQSAEKKKIDFLSCFIYFFLFDFFCLPFFPSERSLCVCLCAGSDFYFYFFASRQLNGLACAPCVCVCLRVPGSCSCAPRAGVASAVARFPTRRPRRRRRRSRTATHRAVCITDGRRDFLIDQLALAINMQTTHFERSSSL